MNRTVIFIALTFLIIVSGCSNKHYYAMKPDLAKDQILKRIGNEVYAISQSPANSIGIAVRYLEFLDSQYFYVDLLNQIILPSHYRLIPQSF